MQRCATLLAPRSRWPTGLDRDLMDVQHLHPMPPPAMAAVPGTHTHTLSLSLSHTHTRGHERASGHKLEAGRRTETDRTSPLGPLQEHTHTLHGSMQEHQHQPEEHFTSRTPHAEKATKVLGKWDSP
ncbi:hypothetical protein CORC01_13495 [Colletotrichum orchidophilum]|uniref:Uncharacterized protein n=1 Tax=Colletotrichum orchidophilum TaxID=1209926 RepID=A0A1G4APW2_9PEZI|nr:uncharacterized protein CORC01_13495 [Colletotrichum orchidophilum]OHE91218.1 hypothetical protein CORC01_13495 [Colletotrichum orchidophilum]